MFHYYNPNPNNRFHEDCVVRAICKLEKREWDSVYLDLCYQGYLEKDMPSVNRVWNKFITRLGYSKYVVPNTCPDCYTVQDFCSEHKEGRFLLATGEHVVAVVDGDYYDAWDSGNEVPVYYWHKEDK